MQATGKIMVMTDKQAMYVDTQQHIRAHIALLCRPSEGLSSWLDCGSLHVHISYCNSTLIRPEISIPVTNRVLHMAWHRQEMQKRSAKCGFAQSLGASPTKLAGAWTS